jgi:hypothetical protein
LEILLAEIPSAPEKLVQKLMSNLEKISVLMPIAE